MIKLIRDYMIGSHGFSFKPWHKLVSVPHMSASIETKKITCYRLKRRSGHIARMRSKLGLDG